MGVFPPPAAGPPGRIVAAVWPSPSVCACLWSMGAPGSPVSCVSNDPMRPGGIQTQICSIHGGTTPARRNVRGPDGTPHHYQISFIWDSGLASNGFGLVVSWTTPNLARNPMVGESSTTPRGRLHESFAHVSRTAALLEEYPQHGNGAEMVSLPGVKCESG